MTGRLGPLCLADAVAILSVVTIGGCGRWEIPSDPYQTYERVSKNVMRVGATERPPWVIREGDVPRGIEPELVGQLAKQLSASVEWRFGSETDLIDALEHGELDLVIGGFRQSTPWSDRVGTSQHYAYDGKDKMVFLVRQGENRWLLTLDRFLIERRADITARIDRELMKHGDLSGTGVSP